MKTQQTVTADDVFDSKQQMNSKTANALKKLSNNYHVKDMEDSIDLAWLIDRKSVV